MGFTMKTKKRSLSLLLAFALAIGVFAVPTTAYAAGTYTPYGNQALYKANGINDITFYDIYGAGTRPIADTAGEFFLKAASSQTGANSSTQIMNLWQNVGVYSAGSQLVNNSAKNNINYYDIRALQNRNGDGSPKSDTPGSWDKKGPFISSSLSAVPTDIVQQVNKFETDNNKDNSQAFPGLDLDHVDKEIKDATGSGPAIWMMQYKNWDAAGRGPDICGVATVLHDFKLQYINVTPLNTAGGGAQTLAEAAAIEQQKNPSNPGVTFSDGGAGSVTYIGGYKNFSSSPVQSQQTLTQSHELNVTNTWTNTFTKMIQEELGVEMVSAFDIPLIASEGFKVTTKFTSQQVWTSTTGNSTSNTDSNSQSTTTTVNVPAHAAVVLKQSTQKTTATLNYDYPVAISYQVSVLVFGGEKGTTDTTRVTRVMKFGGRGDVNEDAVNNLNNLWNNRSTLGYSSTYGDGLTVSNAWAEGKHTVRTVIDSDSYDVTDFGLSLFTVADVTTNYFYFPSLAMYPMRPMSLTGGKLSYTANGSSTEVYEYQPLYPLRKILPADPALDSINMAPGDFRRVDTIGLQGLNSFDVPYYGFRSSLGHWELVDAAGNPAGSSIAALTTDTASGQTTLTAKGEGMVYLKYFIDEHSYSYFENLGKETWQGKEVPLCTKNVDLSSTAVIPVKVIIPRATVSGSVFDAGTNLGLGGVTVVLKDANDQTVGTDVADNAGRYSFDGITPGTYTVTGSRASYITNTSLPFDMKGVDITKNLYLAKMTYTVSGKITDSSGAGLGSAMVTLKYRNDDVDMTVTDADGNYTFEYVPAGNAYTVSASLKGYETGSASFNVTDNVADKNLALAKLPLSAYSVTVNVSDDASPVAIPALLTLKDSGGNVIERYWAGADGVYVFTNVQEGTDYTLTAEYPAYETKTISFNVPANTQKLMMHKKTYTASMNPASKPFTFDDEGYAQPAAQVFTVNNTGTGQLTGLKAALGGSDFEISADLSGDTLDPGQTATISVRPKAGLTANTYSDTLTVTGDRGILLKASVSFVVNAVPSIFNNPDNILSIRASQTVLYIQKGCKVTLPPVVAYTKIPEQINFTWESGDTGVASISGTTLYALQPGSVVVTATAPCGKTFKLLVNVVNTRTAVYSVAISKAPKTMKVGKSVFLKASIAPYNATGKSGAVISWKSSNSKVLSVDAAGKITALHKGTAKITAKAGGHKTVVTIKVK